MESTEHPTTTWPMKEWLLRRLTKTHLSLSRTWKRARVCVWWSIVCTPSVAFMAVATVWTRNCQKKSQDYKWKFSLSWWQWLRSCCWRLLHKSPCASRSRRSWRCHRYCWSNHSSSCHPWVATDGPKMKNSTTSSFLSMSRMKTMLNTLASGNSTTPYVVGLLNPMCHFVLFSLLVDYEVLLCLEIVESWQELVLMFYNQVDDTVLLVCWNQRLSYWQCCYIVLVVGKVHCCWCSGDVTEGLDKRLRPSNR